MNHLTDRISPHFTARCIMPSLDAYGVCHTIFSSVALPMFIYMLHDGLNQTDPPRLIFCLSANHPSQHD